MDEALSILVDRELIALHEEVAWLRKRVAELESGPLRFRALVSTAEGWDLALPFATMEEAVAEGRKWHAPDLGDPVIEVLCPIRGWTRASSCIGHRPK
jgi:hypothetical protein